MHARALVVITKKDVVPKLKKNYIVLLTVLFVASHPPPPPLFFGLQKLQKLMWGLRVSCVDLDLGAAEQHFMNDSYICSLFLFRAVIIINRSVYSILYVWNKTKDTP